MSSKSTLGAKFVIIKSAPALLIESKLSIIALSVKYPFSIAGIYGLDKEEYVEKEEEFDPKCIEEISN